MNTIKYDDGMEYYKSLKAAMKAASNGNGNGNDEERYNFKPSNVFQIVESLDKDCDKFKTAFVSFYVILTNSYRTAVLLNRQKNIKLIRKDASKLKTAAAVESTKITRAESIPAYFMDCESIPAKAAVVLFLTQGYSESMKNGLLFSILNGDKTEELNMTELMGFCRQNVEKLRKYIETANCTSTEEQRKSVIAALIEIAELVKERACSRLAMNISQSEYISLIRDYLKRNLLHSIAPFEALINKYLKDHIAMTNREKERTKIYNQLKVNISTTIEDIIQSIPPPERSSKVSTKACIFKPDQIYEFYKGVPNYTRDIVSTYYHHNGRRYKILTYNDCLFDVLGYVHESSDKKTSECELFDKMSWSERIALVPYRTKILILQETGRDLNQLNCNADLTVSWMDENGLSCVKTFSIRKREKKN